MLFFKHKEFGEIIYTIKISLANESFNIAYEKLVINSIKTLFEKQGLILAFKTEYREIIENILNWIKNAKPDFKVPYMSQGDTYLVNIDEELFNIRISLPIMLEESILNYPILAVGLHAVVLLVYAISEKIRNYLNFYLHIL